MALENITPDENIAHKALHPLTALSPQSIKAEPVTLRRAAIRWNDCDADFAMFENPIKGLSSAL